MSLVALDDSGTVEADLLSWVGEVCQGKVVRCVQASGGNRRRSWAVDVCVAGGAVRELFLRHDPREGPIGAEPYTIAREAAVYRAIAPIPVKAPRIIAFHEQHRAILTDRAEGIAEFRHLKDPVAKQSIAHEFMANLAVLHHFDARAIALDGSVGGRIADQVGKELSLWRSMYQEVGQPDALIDLAFTWLEANLPDFDGPAAMVHGDAGPGNFLFHQGKLSALIDWEFAHLGDPVEDIAWFSMRCVMEPVPDFPAALAEYETAVGSPIDRVRHLYHRVLVSTRVCVIRHRNFGGELGHVIVSRGLNRRLLVEALMAASGMAPTKPKAVASAETGRTAMYSQMIEDFATVIVARSSDKSVIAAAKNAAKVTKYLKAIDQFGPSIEAAKLEAMTELLGKIPQSVDAGYLAITDGLRNHSLALREVLDYFASDTMWDAQLSAEASGSIAHRHYPTF